MPRWLLLAGALIVVGAVLVGLAHKPTKSQQADDLEAVLTTMTKDVESCAGGVGESLSALRQVNAGANSSQNIKDGIKIARYGAANCSPANNQLLDDLIQYQVHESLAAYHLERAVNGLVDWCFPYAQRVQNDIANELSAHDAAMRQQYAAALRRDTQDLNHQRAKVDRILMVAVNATGAKPDLPHLPG
jgi:hypothetical protein